MKRVLCLIALCLGAAPIFGQESAQPTIFVAPLKADLTQIQGWQPALGEGLAEMLTTELAKLNKFQVLESTALEHLKNEIQLGEEGYVAQDEKVEKGGFAGADFMFVGTVTRFGAKRQGANLGGFVPGSLGNLGIKRNRADVRIDWRIVDASSRKLVKAGQSVAEEVGVGFDVGVAVNGHGGNIGFKNEEFMNSALGKATVKAINKIMMDIQGVTPPPSGRQRARTAATQALQVASETFTANLKATPGKVLAVPSKGVLIVTLGSKHGFKAGDKLKLFQTEDIKDEKGEVVFSEEKLVGEITLDAVQEERSKASYSGSAEPKTGWVVKGN